MQALLGTVYLDVSELHDEQELDLVEHRYPEVDGAEQEPTGRAPYSWTLDVGFLGEWWRTAFDAVQAMFEAGEPVYFTHPRTGRLHRVRIKRFRPAHSTRIQNGCLATIGLVEDNLITVGLVVVDAGVPGAAADFDAAATAAETALGAL